MTGSKQVKSKQFNSNISVKNGCNLYTIMLVIANNSRNILVWSLFILVVIERVVHRELVFPINNNNINIYTGWNLFNAKGIVINKGPVTKQYSVWLLCYHSLILWNIFCSYICFVNYTTMTFFVRNTSTRETLSDLDECDHIEGHQNGFIGCADKLFRRVPFNLEPLASENDPLFLAWYLF